MCPSSHVLLSLLNDSPRLSDASPPFQMLISSPSQVHPAPPCLILQAYPSPKDINILFSPLPKLLWPSLHPCGQQ